MKRLLSLILVCLFLIAFTSAQNNSFELKLIAKFDAVLNEYGQISFTPNGKYFFALEYKKKLQVWETETQKHLYTINSKFESAKFSPDGKLLAVFSEKEGQILETETGKTRLNINIYREKISFLNWSPNSRKFAVGTENFDVDVWDAETEKSENSFRIHEKKKGFWKIDEPGIYSITVEFSPDGKRLLTNCSDQEAEYWNLDNGKLFYRFSNSYNPIRLANFSPDGKWIMTRSYEETILWNAETGGFVKSLLGFIWVDSNIDLIDKFAHPSENPNCSRLKKQNFLRPQKQYHGIEFWSPDCKTFVTQEENWCIWSSETGNLINVFKIRASYEILGGYTVEDYFDYHPNSKILMVLNDKELRFFSTVRYEQLFLSLKAESPATWSPDGKYLLAKEKNKIALRQVIEK